MRASAAVLAKDSCNGQRALVAAKTHPRELGTGIGSRDTAGEGEERSVPQRTGL